MKTVTFGPNVLVLYDSIFNIPPHRESIMNYYAMSEAGIGHDWNSIQSHLSGVVMAAHQGLKDVAYQAVLSQEIENLTLGYISMASKYNPEYISWLCLIRSINGEPLDDLSEENLISVGEKLSMEVLDEYGWREISEIIKKKFPTSWLPTSQTG